LTKIIIKEENFKWHLEAFASELFIYAATFFWLSYSAFLCIFNYDHAVLFSFFDLVHISIYYRLLYRILIVPVKLN